MIKKGNGHKASRWKESESPPLPPRSTRRSRSRRRLLRILGPPLFDNLPDSTSSQQVYAFCGACTRRICGSACFLWLQPVRPLLRPTLLPSSKISPCTALPIYNKALLRGFFPFPWLLTAVQMGCSSLGTFVAAKVGIYRASRLSNERETVLYALSFLFSCEILASNVSLKLVAIPVSFPA